ncbi:YggT family protein [Micrococcus sp. HG099]|uniref:YggT family protein n=1 Tax=Micrococcus TaxID=1269 RepID=UPI0002D2DF3F|nr:YggT family protein [Micrococcus sp. HG099]MCR8675473.1 YggT family protein [Micrococcus sp. HG099]
MQLILALVYIVLTVVLAALTVRIVLDVTQSFARRWRPTGAALVAASAVYAVTDPLMRPVRRAVPPVNLGGIGLDVAFLVVFLGVVLLRVLVLVLAGNL